jgi:Na+/melibiose symporter-like transporter
MFGIFIKHNLIFFISFFVFIFLNIIENLLHFTNGRKENEKVFQFTMPNKRDWLKIIIIMVVFALLQGGITAFFHYYITHKI